MASSSSSTDDDAAGITAEVDRRVKIVADAEFSLLSEFIKYFHADRYDVDTSPDLRHLEHHVFAAVAKDLRRYAHMPNVLNMALFAEPARLALRTNNPENIAHIYGAFRYILSYFAQMTNHNHGVKFLTIRLSNVTTLPDIELNMVLYALVTQQHTIKDLQITGKRESLPGGHHLLSNAIGRLRLTNLSVGEFYLPALSAAHEPSFYTAAWQTQCLSADVNVPAMEGDPPFVLPRTVENLHYRLHSPYTVSSADPAGYYKALFGRGLVDIKSLKISLPDVFLARDLPFWTAVVSSATRVIVHVPQDSLQIHKGPYHYVKIFFETIIAATDDVAAKSTERRYGIPPEMRLRSLHFELDVHHHREEDKKLSAAGKQRGITVTTGYTNPKVFKRG